MHYQYLFRKNTMSNLFYFSNLIFTPFQVTPTLFYPSNLDNLFFMPIHSTDREIMPSEILSQCSQVFEATSNEGGKTTPKKSKTFKKAEEATKKSDFRKQKEPSEEEQEEFKLRQVKTGLRMIYKKKNTESNLVNQTFSFLNSQRSKKMVQAFFRFDSEKVTQYYHLMTKIKKMNRKYISRKYLKRLLEFSNESQFYRTFLKAKLTILKSEDIRILLRSLTYQFLRQNVNMTLLTSSKIYKETLPEHFWRKRQIINFLFSKDEVEV